MSVKETLKAWRIDVTENQKIYNITPDELYNFLEYIAGEKDKSEEGELNKGEFVGNNFKFGTSGSVLDGKSIEYDANDSNAGKLHTEAANKGTIILAQEAAYKKIFDNIINVNFDGAASFNKEENAQVLRNALVDADLMEVDHGIYKNLVDKTTKISNEKFAEFVSHFSGLEGKEYVSRTHSKVQGYLNDVATIPAGQDAEIKITIVNGDYEYESKKMKEKWSTGSGERKNNEVYIMYGIIYNDRDDADKADLTMIAIPSDLGVEIPADLTDAANVDSFKERLYDALKEAYEDIGPMKLKEPYKNMDRELQTVPVGLWSSENLANGTSNQKLAHGFLLDVINTAAAGPCDEIMPSFNLLLLREEGYNNKKSAADPEKQAVYLNKTPSDTDQPVVLLSEIPKVEIDRAIPGFEAGGYA